MKLGKGGFFFLLSQRPSKSIDNTILPPQTSPHPMVQINKDKPRFFFLLSLSLSLIPLFPPANPTAMYCNVLYVKKVVFFSFPVGVGGFVTNGHMLSAIKFLYVCMHAGGYVCTILYIHMYACVAENVIQHNSSSTQLILSPQKGLKNMGNSRVSQLMVGSARILGMQSLPPMVDAEYQSQSDNLFLRFVR